MDIFAAIEVWLADKTKFEAVEILDKVGVPCAPVLSTKDILADESLRKLGMIVEVPHKQRGSYWTVGCPVKFSEIEAPVITGSPLLGEHTDEVLAEVGYSAEEIAAMHEKKAV